MPKEYSVDDILNEVLGSKKTEVKEDSEVKTEEKPKIGSAPQQFVAQLPEDSAEFDLPVLKHRRENPVIDSTDAPTVIHKLDPQKEEEEKLREFVKKEIRESAKQEKSNYSIDIPLDNEEEEEDKFDFENYSQSGEFLKKITSDKVFSGVRTIVAFVCAFLLLLLGFWQYFSVSGLNFLPPLDENLSVYITSMAFIVTMFSSAICYPTVLNGISSFFTFKANSNALVSWLLVFSAVQSGILLFNPNLFLNGTVWLIAPVAVLTLAFNELGKYLKISNDKKNFEILSDKSIDKNVCSLVTDEGLVFELTSKMDITDPVICAGHSTNFACKFMKFINAEMPSDKNMRFLAPIVFFGSIVVALLTVIVDSNATLINAFSAICACLALATPMTSVLCCTLPLIKANSALRRENSFISSTESLEGVSDTNLVYLDSAQLFTSETIHLYVLRTLGDFKIDDCIIDAASITHEAKIPLSNVFLNMVLGDKKLLRKVDSLIYEDDMGLSAWVGGKRVLLGNRELLKTHGIEPPTREFEAKFKVDGREIVYLVNSGDIAAFFVVGYNADEEVLDMVQKLADNKVGLLIRNSDSNLTVKKLSYIFDVDPEDISIVPKTLQNQCDKYTENTMSSPANAVYSNGTKGFVNTLVATIKAKTAVSLASLLQIGSIILGYAIVCFFAFVSGLGQVSLPAILVYQLFWLVAISLVPNLTSYK